MGYTGGRLEPLFDPGLAVRATHEMADDGGDYLYEWIVENTPVSYHGVAAAYQGWAHERSREPGTLKRSWRRGPVEPLTGMVYGGFQVRCWTSDPIAPYVEHDTRPHLIVPVHARMLRFRLWPTGQVVFAKVVHHPGTRGAHMVAFSVHRATLHFAEVTGPALRRWRDRQIAMAA